MMLKNRPKSMFLRDDPENVLATSPLLLDFSDRYSVL